MAFLWTDTLAALLMEHDGIAPEQVEAWRARPVAHRIGEGMDPLTLARGLLGAADAEEPPLEAAARPIEPGVR